MALRHVLRGGEGQDKYGVLLDPSGVGQVWMGFGNWASKSKVKMPAAFTYMRMMLQLWLVKCMSANKAV